MDAIANDAMRYMEQLGTQQWFFLLAAVMAVGAFCLRGFGSRNSY